MKVRKNVIGSLEKCYSLSLLDYQGKSHLLVAAEKVNQCRMYGMDGNLEEVLWDEPGGVMTMVPVPEGGGQFLATWRFYSPNDSKDASIVSVTPENGSWVVRTVAELPFVHRFDILRSGEKKYLIACTLKSGHACKDDWSSPGKVYAASLPEDLSAVDREHPLKLQVLRDGMFKNHGYFRDVEDGRESAVVACEQGIFRFVPPRSGDKGWEIEQLLEEPASDAALLDLDGCGEKELLIFSPFHGDTVSIYKRSGGRFVRVYEHPEKLEFLHAICCGYPGGIPTIFLGYRRGRQELLAVTADGRGGYSFQVLDSGSGPANVLFFRGGKDYLLAANRESDEIALYQLEM